MELKLTIQFAPENGYFTNESLSVIVVLESEEEIKEIKGTKIDWLDGKDVTQKKIKKKQKHKKSGETRTVVKTVDAQSFFNIFKDRKIEPSDDNDSEEEDKIHEKMNETR